MRPSENIEKLIKNINIETTAKTDKAVLGDVVEAFEKSKKPAPSASSGQALSEVEGKESAFIQPSIWRIIMNSRITKLAAAAVIITVVIVGVNQFGGSIDGSSVAWAELVQRIERSYDEYYEALLLAMEEKDAEKAASLADALSEFWQGINMLAEAKLDPAIQLQSEDLLNLIREKTFYDHFDEQRMQQIFLEYANEFMDWISKIEDEAWINEIIHVCKQMEEYAEEIREPAEHPELDFSYAEHCLPGFVTYCEWFKQLPWDNPEQHMMPGMLLKAIERDLKTARREIEALVISDADRHAKRCIQQAQKNVQYLIKKIKSREMVNHWKLCQQLNQKNGELSGLMAYVAIASGDITQTNKIHDPEKIHQILTEEFGNKESFADYFIDGIDQSLDLCEQLLAELESMQ